MNTFPKYCVFVRVPANHRHVICKKINCWKIPEHNVTDVYILMFIYNTRRDTAAEEEFDIAIQARYVHQNRHVLVQRFKKKEMDKKKLLTKTYKY